MIRFPDGAQSGSVRLVRRLIVADMPASDILPRLMCPETVGKKSLLFSAETRED